MSKMLTIFVLAISILLISCQRQEPQLVKVLESTSTVGEVHIEIQRPPAGRAINMDITRPELSISYPAEGDVLTGGTVTVQAAVKNFDLVDYTEKQEANVAGGHLHFFLDGGQYYSTYFPRYTFTNVPQGEHEITVILVNNDHTNLKPLVEKKVEFVMK